MIDTTWCNLNPITPKAALDHVPTQSGLYKLTFKLWDTTYAYIGQAGDLRRRIREYVQSPTQGNHMEFLLLDLMTEAGEAELSISHLGVESQKERTVLETAAVAEARRLGQKCLNRGGLTDIRMQRFRLESEERMLIKDLERVRAKLAKL